jgi:hypothetical protein
LPTKLDFRKIKKARLTKTTPGINNFKNKEQSMINFIQNESLSDQEKKIGTTWTWIYDDEILVGFISLAMFSIDRKEMPQEKRGKYPYSTIPSLLIGQLATNEEYECNGIGTSMIKFALTEGHNASHVMGCRTVALHPLESAISWYESHTPFKLIKRKDKQDIMYFDLLQKP